LTAVREPPLLERVGAVKRFLVFFAAGGLLLSGLWFADTHLVPAPTAAVTGMPVPTRTLEPTPAVAMGSRPRVVVISLDGAQADRVRGYLTDGTMPTLARLAARGAIAEYALSVDPSLTAPAHASLATGAYPAATGVAADRYHRPGDPLTVAANALEGAPLGAEPVWRTAMREARRTAAICWPGVSLEAPTTLADYTVATGTVDAPSAQHEVKLGQAQPWPGAPRSFSPALEGSFTIRKNQVPLATVYVLAVDTTDNNQADYDTFVLSRTRTVDERSARLRVGQMAPLIVDDLLPSGAYFALSQASAQAVKIFQSRVCYNRAQPNELVREINQRFGFFPPGGDLDALEQGWITPEQYVQAVETQSQWISAVTRFVLETYKPELLFACQPPADALQHAFLLVDPRQPGYTAELAAQCDRYVRRGYALADAAVGDLAQTLDLGQTALVVVSGHGMAPVFGQVHLNTILAGYGFLAYGGGADIPVAVAQSKALAFASGAAGQVYINLQGREPAGIVAAADYPTVQDAIVATLNKVKDSAGQPVFSRVLRRAELESIGLSASAVGDVFVQAAPGYTLADDWGNPAILGPAPCRGEHGLPANSPEMHGIFLAAGRGFKAGVQVGPVHVVDLAPTLDRMLSLKPPTPRAGRVLEEVLLP